MRFFTIITFIALSLFACKKDDDSTQKPSDNSPEVIPEVEPEITIDTYNELETQLIFEEDFSTIDEWIVDTTIRRKNRGYFSNYDKISRCYLNDGFLHLTAYLDSMKRDTANGEYYNLEHTAQITRDIGDMPDAERYLVEIKAQYFKPLYNYLSVTGSRGNVSSGSGGSSIVLIIHGMEYDLFGLRGSEEYSTPYRSGGAISECFKVIENETFHLILDDSNQVSKALVGNEIKVSCASQSEYFSDRNVINISTNPGTSSGAGFPPQSGPGECIIDYIKIYAVLE